MSFTILTAIVPNKNSDPVALSGGLWLIGIGDNAAMRFDLANLTTRKGFIETTGKGFIERSHA